MTRTISLWTWLGAFPSSCGCKCISLFSFLLGATTSRGPNYLLLFFWSCQSGTHDSRCPPVCWPTGTSSHQALGKAGVETVRKRGSSDMFVSSNFTCLGTFGPEIKHLKGRDVGNGLLFPLSLTFLQSQPPGSSLPRIQCRRLRLDSAQASSTGRMSLSPSDSPFQSQRLRPPVCSRGPEELCCPIIAAAVSDLNHLCS